jgi:signal peptidase I
LFTTFLRRLWDWSKPIAQALIIWFLVTTFLVEPFRVWPTGSMKNTLLVNDFLFVNKFLYGAELPLAGARLPALREPMRGDIVVVRSIEDPSIRLVKRVIGLPGDTVAMQAGVLLRNGTRVSEPYATAPDLSRSGDPETRQKMRGWQLRHYVGSDPAHYAPDLHDWGPIVVPRDSLFLLGDNRDSSYDGRYYGFVPRENLLGHPFVVYFSYDNNSWRSLPFVTAVRWDRLFTQPH